MRNTSIAPDQGNGNGLKPTREAETLKLRQINFIKSKSKIMKKLLFSAVGVMGVVVSSLAFKTLDNHPLFCTDAVPTTENPDGFCNVTVFSVTAQVRPDHTLTAANCSVNKHEDSPCGIITVYTIDNA